MAMQIDMPKHVDALPQLLWWEADEVAVAIGIFGIGLLTHHMMISLAVMVVVMNIVGKMKADGMTGGAYHIFGSTGLISLNKDFPDLLERDLFV